MISIMTYNERLQQLQAKIFCKKSLEAKLQELKSQSRELDNRVFELKRILQNELGDV